MNNPLSIIKSKLTYFALSALTGAVVATAVVALAVSEKVGAMQLARWQLAAIYVAAIAGGILFALKECPKKSGEEKESPDITGSDSAESKSS